MWRIGAARFHAGGRGFDSPNDISIRLIALFRYSKRLAGSSPSHHEAIKLCWKIDIASISIYRHCSWLTNDDELGMFMRTRNFLNWFVIKILDGKGWLTCPCNLVHDDGFPIQATRDPTAVNLFGFFMALYYRQLLFPVVNRLPSIEILHERFANRMLQRTKHITV